MIKTPMQFYFCIGVIWFLGVRTPVFDFDVEEYSLTNNCEKLDRDALRTEYERLDRILLEVVADMAVLKYHIDYIGKEND